MFKYRIITKDNNHWVYFENKFKHSRYWYKSKYDKNNNIIHHEDCNGKF